ncbi:MAG: hypothetical protein ACXVI9_08360 [Mucilaginibacter sp.]
MLFKSEARQGLQRKAHRASDAPVAQNLDRGLAAESPTLFAEALRRRTKAAQTI